MKRIIQDFVSALIIFLTSYAVSGQDVSTDRVSLTFSDPSRPGRVHASLISGSITVKGKSGDEVIIEARARTRKYSKRKSKNRSEGYEGMKKLAISSTGLEVEEQHNEIRVSAASHSKAIDFTIQVPKNTSLKLSTINNGSILVENIEGDLELNNTNGSIEVYHVSGSAVANTTNGKVKVTFDKVKPKKAMSFVTFNGNVDVTFPANIKANVKMKSDQGEIYSDFDIKLEDTPRLIKEDSRKRGGKYKVKVESTIYGTINGGGPEFHFSTYNGNIYIRKKN